MQCSCLRQAPGIFVYFHLQSQSLIIAFNRQFVFNLYFKKYLIYIFVQHAFSQNNKPLSYILNEYRQELIVILPLHIPQCVCGITLNQEAAIVASIFKYHTYKRKSFKYLQIINQRQSSFATLVPTHSFLVFLACSLLVYTFCQKINESRL